MEFREKNGFGYEKMRQAVRARRILDEKASREAKNGKVGAVVGGNDCGNVGRDRLDVT